MATSTQFTSINSTYRVKSVAQLNSNLAISRQAMSDYRAGKITIHQFYAKSFIELTAMRWDYTAILNVRNGVPECGMMVRVDGAFHYDLLNKSVAYYGNSALQIQRIVYVNSENKLLEVKKCWTSFKGDNIYSFYDMEVIGELFASKNKTVIRKLKALITTLCACRTPQYKLEDFLYLAN